MTKVITLQPHIEDIELTLHQLHSAITAISAFVENGNEYPGLGAELCDASTGINHIINTIVGRME